MHSVVGPEPGHPQAGAALVLGPELETLADGCRDVVPNAEYHPDYVVIVATRDVKPPATADEGYRGMPLHLDPLGLQRGAVLTVWPPLTDQGQVRR